MKSFSSDLKIGFAALMVTFAVALVMIYISYEKYSLSRMFLGEAQKISATLPVLAVTEGQVAQWTDELRKNEVFEGEMDAHLVEQINNIRLGKYTADELNEHLVSCQRFCGQLLNKIFVANMHEVARLPHEVVFFDLDKDQVTPRYQKELKDFAKKNNNQTLYLMGRASFIGGHGYNKELSGRRVKRVEAILRQSRISEFQIKASWLGYEAPQLTHEIAASYQIDPKEYKGDLFNLNQSVVLFTNTPGEYFPGVVNTMEKALQEKKDSTTPSRKKNEKPQTVSQLSRRAL
ncbi:MAG: OmpA family protein [Acidobacteria bacterium]|nr:OmpA family protein [Acidobacteriota bacterium]